MQRAPYSRKVAEVLRLEPIRALSEQAELVVRGVFLPSFDPEVAVTLAVHRDECEMTIHSALTSIWAHLNAIDGAHFGGATAFVEPAVAVEDLRCALFSKERLRAAAGAVVQAGACPETLGLDGLPLEVTIRVGQGPIQVFSFWSPAPATAGGTFCREVLSIALEHCRWTQSRTALEAVARYL